MFVCAHLAHEVAVVAEAEEKVRQDVDDVRFEDATQNQAEHLEPEQRTCKNVQPTRNF